MTFVKKIRVLHHGKELSCHRLAAKIDFGGNYMNRVENERRISSDIPSDSLIGRLVKALEATEEVHLLLAKRLPVSAQKGFLQSADAFRGFTNQTLETLIIEIVGTLTPRNAKRK